MRGEEVILLNFPISHFLKSLAHSALLFPTMWIHTQLRSANGVNPALCLKLVQVFPVLFKARMNEAKGNG